MAEEFQPLDEQAANLASLREEIALGVADIAAGRVRELDMDEIKRRGRVALGLPTDYRRSRPASAPQARKHGPKVGRVPPGAKR